MDERPLIVVGVDGSAGSRAALAHALADAASRGGRVRAVRAFEPGEPRAVVRAGAPATSARITADIEEVMRRAVAEVVVELGPRAAAVPVDVQALIGHPETVLLEQAADADLLVVGHRGRSALAGVVLGSVGVHCVVHAPCTVTVVRPVGSRAADRASSTPAAVVR